MRCLEKKKKKHNKPKTKHQNKTTQTLRFENPIAAFAHLQTNRSFNGPPKITKSLLQGDLLQLGQLPINLFSFPAPGHGSELLQPWDFSQGTLGFTKFPRFKLEVSGFCTARGFRALGRGLWGRRICQMLLPEEMTPQLERAQL